MRVGTIIRTWKEEAELDFLEGLLEDSSHARDDIVKVVEWSQEQNGQKQFSDGHRRIQMATARSSWPTAKKNTCLAGRRHHQCGPVQFQLMLRLGQPDVKNWKSSEKTMKQSKTKRYCSCESKNERRWKKEHCRSSPERSCSSISKSELLAGQPQN